MQMAKACMAVSGYRKSMVNASFPICRGEQRGHQKGPGTPGLAGEAHLSEL